MTVLVLALLAGGGYAAFLGLSGGSSNASAPPLPLCPVPSRSPVPTHVGPLRLTVMNATERSGLAAEVAAALQDRGFNVTSVGNAVFKHQYSDRDRHGITLLVVDQAQGGLFRESQ